MRTHDWIVSFIGLAALILTILSSAAANHKNSPITNLPSKQKSSDSDFQDIQTQTDRDRQELDGVSESKFNPATLIQNEQRHLQLINPEVESVMGPSQHHPPFDRPAGGAGERGLRREFVRVDGERKPAGKLPTGQSQKDVKLQIRLKLGHHLIPALEYEVPRRWFDHSANVSPSVRVTAKGIERLSIEPKTGQRKQTEKYPKKKLGKEVVKTVAQPPYEPWGPWTKCMGICETGLRERTRECRGGSGAKCDRDMLRERIECNLAPCSASAEKMVHPAHYGEWGAWSPCTATCGTAHRTRVRACLKGKCDPELLREKKYCGSLPSCAFRKPPTAKRKNLKPPLTCEGSVKFFADKELGGDAYSCPLVKHPLAANAKWSSKVPFLFPWKMDGNFKPTEETYLEIKFNSFRTVTGWKITGNGKEGSEGVLASYMVKVHDSKLDQWRNIAGVNNVPSMYITDSKGDLSRSSNVFQRTIPPLPHIDAIRFYPLQWNGLPFFKADIEGCTEVKVRPLGERREVLKQRRTEQRRRTLRQRPTSPRRGPIEPVKQVSTERPRVAQKPRPSERRRLVAGVPRRRVVHHVPLSAQRKRDSRSDEVTRPIDRPSPLECGQIPVEEMTFLEIDYERKVADLGHIPDMQGHGYVNLRLLALQKKSQNHNNHIALEVGLGRQRKVEQLLFKGALREDLPAILRAFYLQFLDPESGDWRWLSHLGKPTPFIVTQIPVLNKEQVQTVFSVRFSQSLSTDRFRIYPELWQQLPLIRMAVVACG